MSVIEIAVGPDEIRGLSAVAKADKAVEPDGADLKSVAGDMLRSGLMAKLEALGLPWPPSSDESSEADAEGSRARQNGGAASTSSEHDDGPVSRSQTDASPTQEPTPPAELLRSMRENERLKMAARAFALFAVAVVLWGGYVQRWSWTGFTANAQLWDWLNLLLLPVAFATLPLWLQHSQHISRVRQVVYACALVAFAGFVVAGYLVPLGWTGFSGNKLWDWLTLVVLPAALITVVTWRATGRETKTWHRTLLAALLVGWVITLIGGYAGSWSWTGYEGNTLWDWVNLLLLPSIFPIIVAPAAVRFVTGNVEERVEKEREKVAAEAAAKEAVSGHETPIPAPVN